MIRKLLLTGLVCVGLAACQTNPFGNVSDPNALPDLSAQGEGIEAPVVPETGLPLSTEQRFDDIPLPVDAREDLDRTYVYESKTLQIGRMVYTSKSSVNELAQFYIHECPAADWTLDNVLQANGARLVFSKPGKRLEVIIQPQGVGRSQLLILNLTPTDSTGKGS